MWNTIYITCVSGRHSRNTVRHQFFAKHFASWPFMFLKFGHMIDVGYIYHGSKFQKQTRSRSKTSGKKLMPINVSAVPSWNTSAVSSSAVYCRAWHLKGCVWSTSSLRNEWRSLSYIRKEKCVPAVPSACLCVRGLKSYGQTPN